MSEAMLEINKLSCGYDSKVVIKDISCQVGQKEIVGIIGPNGSGKTTLLRTISRVLKPKLGEILLQGTDIRQMSVKDLARKIAVVAQNLPAGSISVEEFVLLGRIPHLHRLQFLETRHDLEVAEQAMRLTGSWQLREQYIDEISGGERQLAHIARALAQEPNLLLLDEPTAHLDITHQVGVLDLIKRLNREFGLTVIMVLHDLNLASAYCERLILLHNGAIHQQGLPKEVLTYQTIEEAYRTVVLVKQDPLTSRPYIFLVPEDTREARK